MFPLLLLGGALYGAGAIFGAGFHTTETRIVVVESPSIVQEQPESAAVLEMPMPENLHKVRSWKEYREAKQRIQGMGRAY